MDKDDEKKLPEEKKNNIINTEDSLGEFLIYTTPDGEKQIQVRLIDETVWLSQKLMAELLQRGISKDIANEVLDEYFSQNDEEYICKKAYEKFYKHGKRDEKLLAAMVNAGFSYKMVKEIQKSEL